VKNFLPVFKEETDKIVAEMEENHLDGNEFDLCESIVKLVDNIGSITIFSLRDQLELSLQMAEPIEK
jgi:hypothetical protein